MPQSQIDFSKYEAQAPPSIEFSKYAQDQTQANAPGAVSRFLSRATGGLSDDIAAHPGAYNPLGPEYWQRAKDNANQPLPSAKLPFEDTAADLKSKNYAGVAGDILPGALAIASMAGFRKGAPEIPERVPLWKQAGIEAGHPEPNIQVTQVPEPTPSVEPTALEQAKARFQAAQQPQPSTQAPESYPNGVQKRPTDRAEILDDKAVREQMQKDLGLQGYRGAREVGEENAPVPKWQQVAQAKAQSVIDSAHEQAAQILADAEKAATTPAKLTKTPSVKSAAASQTQPVAEDLNSPDRLIDLMQQSIDRLKAAKGK